jgi:hypothetical protein
MAIDQVRGGMQADQVRDAPSGVRQAADAVLNHDRAYQLDVHMHLVIVEQLYPDSAAAVRAARALMDLGDRVGHNQPADLAIRHRPSSVVLQVRSG